MNDTIKDNTELSGEVEGVLMLAVDSCPYTPPKHLSELAINNNLTFQMASPMPNRWYRFWYKFLLGWEWRSLE